MRGESNIDKRRRDILAAIVRQYTATADPVGSKAVAAGLLEPLSPASVRNLMAEFEAEGYLIQPHTSAGRVPTDKAYRFYVDQMGAVARIAPDTERYIYESLSAETDAPEHLMARTSRVLSEVSHHVGLVLGPMLEEKLLEHIKFVKLPERRVLAVIVSKPDLIENKIVHLDEEISQAELDRTADYLNAEFRGWSLRTIRLEVFKRLEELKELYARLLSNVAMLLMWGALAAEVPGPLFVEGTARILEQPEFVDLQKTREFLAAFEEKERLIKILTACLESPSSGVRTLIGRENPDHRMHHCTFIVAPFHYRDRVVGALGVVGPTRMEYDRAITTVEYVARLCSRLLSSN